MRSRRLFPTGPLLVFSTAVLLAGMSVLGSTSLKAQQWDEKIPGNAGEWNVRMLRPSGQPVIPIFDGWVLEDDGTATLCLGYFNLNFDEALEIPLGPNNYIEPARFNGIQPTYFNPVPMRARNKQRNYCVLTFNVPQGETERIVWHLRRDYRDFSAPAHPGAEHFRVNDIFFPTDRAERGGSMAPLVRFVEPAGPEGIGKGMLGGKRVGPVMAKVGEPLPLTLAVRQPSPTDYPEVAPYTGDPKNFEVFWAKYSGPPDILGIVTFSENEFRVGPGEGLAETTAMFQQPGDYVLIVQVLGGAFDNQCCWTNGYVEVTVTR